MERLGSRQMTKSSTWSGNGNGDVLGEGVGNFSPKRTGWIFLMWKNWVFSSWSLVIWVFSTWICVCFWEGVFFYGLGSYGITIFPPPFWFFHFASERSGWISMGDHCRFTKLFSLQPPATYFYIPKTPQKKKTKPRKRSLKKRGKLSLLFDMFPLFLFRSFEEQRGFQGVVGPRGAWSEKDHGNHESPVPPVAERHLGAKSQMLGKVISQNVGQSAKKCFWKTKCHFQQETMFDIFWYVDVFPSIVFRC